MVSRVIILIRLFESWADAGNGEIWQQTNLKFPFSRVVYTLINKVESVRPVWSKERKVSQNFLHFDF